MQTIMPSGLRALRLTCHQQARLLQIVWEDGTVQVLPYQHLRAACRCADCTALRRQRAAALAIDPAVLLLQILPVGRYGVQLVFDDGHQRGIYPWVYLRGLSGDSADRADSLGMC